MQPYFFPYAAYFQLIKSVDKYILYGNLDYIKEGWMHRNKILIRKQNPNYITVKLVQKSSNKKITDIELYKSIFWKKKIVRGIEFNYNKSKYFDEVFSLVKDIIFADYKYLHDYNSNCIVQISNYLGLSTQIITNYSEYLLIERHLDLIYQSSNDVIHKIYGDYVEKKTARVIEICKKEKAYIFINAIGGNKLYSKEQFKKNNIDLYFLKTGNVCYKQFNDRFIPNLSIIDMLMHCGRELSYSLLDVYELI